MNVHKYKKSLFAVFLTAVSLFFGCSGTSTDPNPDPEQPFDRFSGVYYMSGEKISTGITCVHCSGSQPYEQRTTYSFNVEWTADSPDRIRFFGLEGADAGASRYRVFPGCTHPDNCEVYGKIIGLEEFEIDIEQEGRRFRANGVFRTVSVELSGQFTFDDITITYDLSGNRVDF